MPSALSTGLVATWAALHTLQFGFGISALNGVQDVVICPSTSAPPAQGSVPRGGAKWGLEECIPMTTNQFGLVVSIFTLGGLLGAIGATKVTDRLGRLWTLRVSALLVGAGSALVGVANSFWVILAGRILLGLGCGLATVTVPLYLAEIAPPSIKQSLGVLNQLFIVFGLFTAQSLSLPFAKPWEWRWVMLVAVGISAVQLLGSLLVSEPEEEEGEAGEETALLGDAGDRNPMTIGQLLTSKDSAVSRGLVVVILTQLFQQLCGISPVMYFSTSILKPVFQANSKYIALLVVAVKIPVTMVPAFIIQRFGSKSILLFSASLMGLASLLLAIGLNASIQPLAVTSVLLFVSAFSMGLGPVTWVVLPEVMPRHARTAAGSVGLAINWTANFAMGASFLPLQQWLATLSGNGEGNIFFMFAAFCALGFIAIGWSFARRERIELP